MIAQDNGRSVDQRMIEKDFNQLKTTAGPPNVIFHSLRHSSTTYKLKLNPGDLKATQGDTGHAEVDMMSDKELEERLFPSAPGKVVYKMPDYVHVHREMQRQGVTLPRHDT